MYVPKGYHGFPNRNSIEGTQGRCSKGKLLFFYRTGQGCVQEARMQPCRLCKFTFRTIRACWGFKLPADVALPKGKDA